MADRAAGSRQRINLIVVACEFCKHGIGILAVRPEHVSSSTAHWDGMQIYEIATRGRHFDVIIKPEHERHLALVSNWIQENYQNLEHDHDETDDET